MTHRQWFKKTPVLLTGSVVGLVGLFHLLGGWFPEREPFLFGEKLEWMSYDWRVRQAVQASTGEEVSTNIAAVFIDDESLALVNQAWSYSWPWPRKLHAQLVRRLSAQGAKAIGFDILFQERHPPSQQTDIPLPNGLVMGSDSFFARELYRAGNVVLAAFGETSGEQWRGILPADLFRTNAWAVAHATSEKDQDGVLRRVRAYRDDPRQGRLWHLGIVMAAKALDLDLDRARVLKDRILLPGPAGFQRVIPIDEEGLLYVNWVLRWNDPRITKASFEQAAGFLGDVPAVSTSPAWKDKLVFVGSIGSGNNISDVGATPLAKETYLVGNHWNVANSVLTGRFVYPPSRIIGFFLILILGLYSGLVTWRTRAPWPSILVLLTAVAYTGAAVALFIRHRYWLPIVMPVAGGLLLTHVCLVIYQVLFEQREKRRVRHVFSRLVSPEVVTELLDAEQLNLGGARRTVTVMFTDVRGFTQMTDSHQEEAELHAASTGLSREEAEAYFDDRARETLATVNDYLAAVADQIKKHQGTLDKYIGDCVMAFWGAPVPDEHHAVHCVEAAIDAQLAIERLNRLRHAENQRRQAEHDQGEQEGKRPLPLLPLLSLGTGINTGEGVVGLMGSEDHILNYTVFGRDVNVASRLEAVSGRSRIIIGEKTFQDLKRLRPDLADRCRPLPAVTVKGIRSPVAIHEVRWRRPQAEPTLPAASPDQAKAA